MKMSRDQIAQTWLTLKTLYGFFNFDRTIKAISWPLKESGMAQEDPGKEAKNEGRDRHGSARSGIANGHATNGKAFEESGSDAESEPGTIANQIFRFSKQSSVLNHWTPFL
jgi:hypothetical protein